MAGYSGKPLASKLGIQSGCKVFLVNAPDEYLKLVDPLPDGVTIATRLTSDTDFVHVFTSRKTQLAAALRSCRAKIRSDAMVWVSWPKKSSKVPSDVTEGTIREIALPMGFVDIKVCAVSDVWSGLKLVVRKELR